MRAMVLTLFACVGCASSIPPQSEAEAQPEAAGPRPSTPTHERDQPGTGEPRCTPTDDWSACEGREVELRGQAPQMVMQHPVLSQPEGLSPDNRNSYQGYLEVDQAQVIVLTNAAFACPGAMRVVGTLARVDLGGEPGTKGSYAGWSVSDAVVTCE
jgi:hypothetical protein